MANKTRVKVRIDKYKGVDKALKVFKQKVLDFNLKNELKKRSFHESKGLRKRNKKKQAMKRLERKLRREKFHEGTQKI